mgnify:CR=1 FL=1
MGQIIIERKEKILWNISGNRFATQKEANHFHSTARKKLFLQTNFFYFVPFHFGTQQSNDNSFHDTVTWTKWRWKKIIGKGMQELAGLTGHSKAYIYFERPLLNFYITIGFKIVSCAYFSERGGLFMNYISYLNIIFINYVPRTIINTHWVKLCEISAEISRYIHN